MAGAPILDLDLAHMLIQCAGMNETTPISHDTAAVGAVQPAVGSKRCRAESTASTTSLETLLEIADREWHAITPVCSVVCGLTLRRGEALVRQPCAVISYRRSSACFLAWPILSHTPHICCATQESSYTPSSPEHCISQVRRSGRHRARVSVMTSEREAESWALPPCGAHTPALCAFLRPPQSSRLADSMLPDEQMEQARCVTWPSLRGNTSTDKASACLSHKQSHAHAGCYCPTAA